MIAATNRPGHPRPGAAAPGPLRPSDRRRPPRPQGPREDPRGAHARQAAGEGHRHRRARRPDAGLHRRRPVEPDQRGGAAVGAHGQARDRPGRARGGDHARDRRPREEDARDEREGAADHGLPRDGPRDRRPFPGALRPGAQDLRDLTRAGARLHDLDAPGGPLPDDARRAQGHDGDDARRPRGGGTGVLRDHHRRVQRHREGDRDGQADGDALRHVREARPARVRPRPRPAVPRPRVLHRARLLRRNRARDRRRGAADHRDGPPARARHPHRAPLRADEDLGDPRQTRDDREGGVPRAARRQERGGGVRHRRGGQARAAGGASRAGRPRRARSAADDPASGTRRRDGRAARDTTRSRRSWSRCRRSRAAFA